jgi:hypothetical protein
LGSFGSGAVELWKPRKASNAMINMAESLVGSGN